MTNQPDRTRRRIMATFAARIFRHPRWAVENVRLYLRRQAKLLSFALYLALDRLGVHVLPKHYYTPVPDMARLRARKDLWTGPSAMAGIASDSASQIEWLRQTCQPFASEVKGLEIYEHAVAAGRGPGYGPIESQALHCVIRSQRPRRMIEIGSGVSTACSLHALRQNRDEFGDAGEITCIEPYPRSWLREAPDIRLMEASCQEVPLGVFQALEAGDILFIDSSHAVKVGSEVARIYTDIIPSLRPGVIVHIHDIYLPYQYSRHALETYFSWQETVLLQALLIGNRALRLLAALSLLHYERPDELADIFPDYVPQANVEGLRPHSDSPGHFPSSTWLEVRGADGETPG